MSELTFHQAEPLIGDAPTQELHVIDDRDLRAIETNGFGIYLALSIAFVPAGIGIGATLAAWWATCAKGSSVFDTIWGYVFFAITVAFLAAGIALLFPAVRNCRTTKSLIREIRRRRPPAPGVQEELEGGPNLQPVVRR